MATTTTDPLPERTAQGLLRVGRNAVLGGVTLVVLGLLVLGVVLIPVFGLGVPVLVEVAALLRHCASEQRHWVGQILGTPLTEPAVTQDADSMRGRLAALVRDRTMRREVLWVVWQSVAGPAGALAVIMLALIAYACVTVAMEWWQYVVVALPAMILLGIAALIAIVLGRGHALVSRWLLADRAERSSASARIAELTRTRASTVDAQAAELRRIERDLHDGVQARLVAVGLSVGMARAEVRRAPEQAEALLDEVAHTVGAALDELRALVRGIHPPVLAERGLSSAIEALAVASAVPVRTQIDVAARFEAPVESAVYFAAAEALTNVSRHAGASTTALVLGHDAGLLTLSVVDDGHGGADLAQGTGLAGIRDRLAAFDGTMTVSSPAGGPTTIHMEVPCAPLSPRTRPSSETGSPVSSPPTASP